MKYRLLHNRMIEGKAYEGGTVFAPGELPAGTLKSLQFIGAVIEHHEPPLAPKPKAKPEPKPAMEPVQPITVAAEPPPEPTADAITATEIPKPFKPGKGAGKK